MTSIWGNILAKSKSDHVTMVLMKVEWFLVAIKSENNFFRGNEDLTIPVYLTDFTLNLSNYWLTCKHVIFIYFALHPLHHPYSNIYKEILSKLSWGFVKIPDNYLLHKTSALSRISLRWPTLC